MECSTKIKKEKQGMMVGDRKVLNKMMALNEMK